MTNQVDTTTPANTAEGDAISAFFKRGEVWLGLCLMVVLTFLVLPIPALAVDFGLAISITFSVVVLMTVVFISKALDFSAFPTVLLIATLIRLALKRVG